MASVIAIGAGIIVGLAVVVALAIFLLPRRNDDKKTSKGRYDDLELSQAQRVIRTPSSRALRTTEQMTDSSGLDRNASVRSTITLPSYSVDPRDTERVLGQEGERAGMDTVIEYPETIEEEEISREEEMDSLFQIREARRREIAERDARRRERLDARNRGDWQRLEDLHRESRLRARVLSENGGSLESELLIAEHQTKPRERRVSAVEYAEVGHVTHDGSRVRASSIASDETGGLLDRAAPMGDAGSRNGSQLSLDFGTPSRSRQRSTSAASSVGTDASMDQFDLHSPGRTIRDSTVILGRQVERQSLPPNYANIEQEEAPEYTEEEIRRRESQRSTYQQMTTRSGLSVPIITVQGASEPNSPVVARVSEDYHRISLS